MVMHSLARLALTAPKLRKVYNRRRGQFFQGLPGQGGNWKAHWNGSGTRRSSAYRQSIKILDAQRALELRKENWKFEQIEKLKKRRAMAARVKSRPGDNGEVAQKIGSMSTQEIRANT